MTTMAWNRLPYYGRKLKNYFKFLDGQIMTRTKKENLDINDIEFIVKLIGRQAHTVHTINKLIESTDVIRRLENIEAVIAAIPPEQLAAAKIKLGQ